MKITVEFVTGNAAFADDFSGEVTFLLQQANERIREAVATLEEFPKARGDTSMLRDSNGNNVGTLLVKRE